MTPVETRSHNQLVHAIIFNITVPDFQERGAEVCGDFFYWYCFTIRAVKFEFANMMSAFIRFDCIRIFAVYLKTHVLEYMDSL